MDSKIKVLGHPVHQTLIVLPLGLFAAAVVFDVVHAFGDDATMAVVAYWMITAGIVGAPPNAWMMSNTTAAANSPSGSTISVWWTGCPSTLILLSMPD